MDNSITTKFNNKTKYETNYDNLKELIEEQEKIIDIKLQFLNTNKDEITNMVKYQKEIDTRNKSNIMDMSITHPDKKNKGGQE